MNWFEAMLKRAHLLPQFTQDDVLNAENADDLRTHSLIVHAVSEAIERRVHGNATLRHAIDQAKERTPDVRDFERKIRGFH